MAVYSSTLLEVSMPIFISACAVARSARAATATFVMLSALVPACSDGAHPEHEADAAVDAVPDSACVEGACILPSTPVPTSPSSPLRFGSVHRPGSMRPTFAWERASEPGPEDYELQYGTDSTFANAITENLSQGRLFRPAADLEARAGTTLDPAADVVLDGPGGGPVGFAIAGAGDVNGDGADDLLVSHAEPTAWRVLLLNGSRDGAMDAVPDAALSSGVFGDRFGVALAGVGDLDGDGFADVMVGATEHENRRGAAYFYRGGPGTFDADHDATALGLSDDHQFGKALAAAGDVNGDGFADAVIGAEVQLPADEVIGRAYVFAGGADFAPTSTAVFLTSPGAALGSVGGGDDVDGDGFDDVVVGIVDPDGGWVNVYHGEWDLGGDEPAVPITAPAPASGVFGWAVGLAGDVDADGLADLVVGAPISGAGEGIVHVYRGGSELPVAGEWARLASLSGFGWCVD